jgi:hypothetical protein
MASGDSSAMARVAEEVAGEPAVRGARTIAAAARSAWARRGEPSGTRTRNMYGAPYELPGPSTRYMASSATTA